MFGGSSIRDFKKTDGVSGNFQQKFKVYGKNNTQCPRHGCNGYIQKILVLSKEQPFIVQNVRSNDNKYLLTKTLVKAI